MIKRKRFTNGVDIKLFYEGEQPDGWIKYRSAKAIAATEKSKKENLSEEERQRQKEQKRQKIIEKYGSWEEYVKQRKEKSIKTKIDRYGSIEEFNRIAKEAREKTMIEKYGVPHNFCSGSPSIEKRRETWIENYGVDHPMKSAEVRESTKQTCLEKYGVDSYNKTKEHREKTEATLIAKHGSLEAAHRARVEKTKLTCLEKYGVESVTQTEDFKAKVEAAKITHFGSLEEAGRQTYEKYKETMLEHYGVDNYFKSTEFKEWMTEEHKQARVNASNETKRKNNTFHTSVAEKKLYEELIVQFGENDVVQSYKDVRYARSSGYMFHCDFYIKSQDLFIELNLHPTHGPHPFDPNSEEDIALLEKLREDSSPWALNTIAVWTRLDVEKQNIAKKNNLNYKVIYKYEECKELFR